MLPDTPILLLPEEVKRLLDDGDRRAFIWSVGAMQFVCAVVGVALVDLVRYLRHDLLTFHDLSSSASIVLIFSLGGWGAGWLLWRVGYRPRRPRRAFTGKL